MTRILKENNYLNCLEYWVAICQIYSKKTILNLELRAKLTELCLLHTVSNIYTQFMQYTPKHPNTSLGTHRHFRQSQHHRDSQYHHSIDPPPLLDPTNGHPRRPLIFTTPIPSTRLTPFWTSFDPLPLNPHPWTLTPLTPITKWHSCVQFQSLLHECSLQFYLND